MEIDSVYASYRSNKTEQYNTYTNRSLPTQEPLIGYVVGVSLTDALTETYKVMVPSMGNITLTGVPRVVPDSSVAANGIGKKPYPLATGQPVLIRFLGRSRTAYIDGSLYLNGSLEEWSKGNVPAIDAKDVASNNNLYAVPNLALLLALKGQAKAEVSPLLLRHSSSSHGRESAAGAELPGSWKIESDDGHQYKHIVGVDHSISSGQVETIDGPRTSLSDAPIAQALRNMERFRYDLKRQRNVFYSTVGGKFLPQAVRAADSVDNILAQSEAILRHLYTIGQISKQQMTFSATELVPLAKKVASTWLGSASFNLNLGLARITFNNAIAPTIKSKINFITGFSTLDSYLQRSLDDLLGKLGAVVSELIGDLLGIDTDALTGSTPSLITGRQPMPLQTEGGLIVGAIRILGELLEIYEILKNLSRNANLQLRLLTPSKPALVQQQATIINSLPAVRTVDGQNTTSSSNTNSSAANSNVSKNVASPSGATTSPVLTLSRPTRAKGPVPFVLVSSEYNSLDFWLCPQDGLAASLARAGVPTSGSLVKSVSRLVTNTGSLSAAVSSLSTIANQPDKLVLDLAKVWYGETPNTTLETIVNSTTLKARFECPDVPPAVVTIALESTKREFSTLQQQYKNYFLLDLPDYNTWIDEPRSILTWLSERNSDITLAARYLFDGQILRFFSEVIYLTTGNDIELAPEAYMELVGYTNRSFGINSIGYE